MRSPRSLSLLSSNPKNTHMPAKKSHVSNKPLSSTTLSESPRPAEEATVEEDDSDNEAIIANPGAIGRPSSPGTANPMVTLRAIALQCPVAQAYREVRDSIASEGLTDFEQIKELVSRIPDESDWPSLNETTKQDIRDVLDILRNADKGEIPERVKARIENFAPGYEIPEGQLSTLTSNLLDHAARSGSFIAEFTEALFGESELEPVQMLLQGYKTARAVAKVQVMDANGRHRASGSGFLVGVGLFLTNHHVLKDAESAARSFVVFDDETPLDGSLPKPLRFRITSDLYCSSESADFAFVTLAPEDGLDTPLSQYGFLNLIEKSGKAIKNEPVSIIQHPNGRPKEIALRNSFVMGRRGNGFYYTTDTLPGTSGSPVTNSQWQVVALHHRYVPHPLDPQVALANRGVRVSAIYAELRAMSASGNQSSQRVLDILAGSPAVSVKGTTDDTDGTFILNSGPYRGLTEKAFLAALGEREAYTDGESDIPLPEVFSGEPGAFPTFIEALAADRESVLRRIGPVSYRLIIGFEVSSRAHYERKLHRPIKPGGASGVTIGIGYDLGFISLSQFREHWSDLLPAETTRRLESCLGKTRNAAAAALERVRDISIPYESAITVFERSTLPKFFVELNRHIRDDVLDKLSPPCAGALVSLVFNRGASFQREGDRFREMRAIREALHAGNLNVVPGLFRSMKRIWAGDPNLRGLLIRRDREADLFDSGISDVPQPQDTAFRSGLPVNEAAAYDPTPDLNEQSEIPIPEISFLEDETARVTNDDVRWVTTFSNNPDYAHLPASVEGASFDLTADLIDRTIELGHYQPHFTTSGNLIVAVRGAAMADGAERILGSASVRLLEQKPDHRRFRCVIVVYHRTQRKVSVFRASTVPNRGGVASCANLLNGRGGTLANMLPTGCYQLCVGTHHGSTTVPTVLRLGSGPEPSSALEVTTLRTRNDGIYGTQDLWDRCRPADNIHPAFSALSAEFSSLGCLTVPGRFASGSHTGLWAEFRRAAGFDGNQHRGARYDLLLTTGMELAAIQKASGTDLRRLANGSQGALVNALQRALGIASPDETFGPSTKKKLVDTEAAIRAGLTTGIYSLQTQQALGFDVF